MRTPARFEKHNDYWWVMGIPPYQVNDETHYALGGYETEKLARAAWADVCNSTKNWWPDYGKTIHECPEDYDPRENRRIAARKKRGRQKRHVVGSSAKVSDSSPEPATPDTNMVEQLVGIDDPEGYADHPDVGLQCGQLDCYGLCELGNFDNSEESGESER